MIRKVVTKYGEIEGLPSADPRVTVFKGVPFAAAPVGENRWRAPQPLKPWDGVLKAYSFAPISFQDVPGLGGNIYDNEWNVDPEIPMSEDCLYLNVWTGAKKTNEKLPVLVWYFGGGFQWGNTQEMEFDGERLARRGIVVVSVNYRLASLGFLAHPELTKNQPGDPTNFGHLDQKAGLRWVYENIEAFGGDPERITIAGQSAGGGSVMAQIACKDNFDVIKGAVVFSGMIRNPFGPTGFIAPPTLDVAEQNGVEFFKYLGVSTVDEARKLSSEFIREKYAEFANSNPRMATTIDNVFIDGDPYTLYAEGKTANIPVLSGNTTDEFHISLPAKDEAEFEEKAKELFGDKAERFLSFPEVRKPAFGGFCDVPVVEYSVKGAFMKRAQNPSNKPGFYYSFDPDIPGNDKPGTFHSVDLWFWFESISKASRPFVGRHFDLARQMANYFAQFVKTGNPNACDIDGAPQAEWKPYKADDKNEMVFTSNGPRAMMGKDGLVEFLANFFVAKKQAVNPYMPSWEYVPDGEPHVFGDRVYVYGSHDLFNGSVFCLGDYICYSAPVDDLKDWRYEGVIYPKDEDPFNRDGHMCLYAPDVTQGPDGRYYLYYVLDKVSVVSVAVCDTPAGKYEFLGYVHYADGTRLGDREGDEPQFDPAVLTEGDKTYLYTGFCGMGDKSRHGAMATVLDKDMLTIIEDPKIVAPGSCYSEGTGFEGHAFFEASSIRKKDGIYYFVYSTQVMHELGYATSDKPTEGFVYRGVIVSNADIGIGSYKDPLKPTGHGANNHGGFEVINGKYYIFYHRHTNGNWFSRQGCAEEITFNADGSINQAEMTSSGLNGGPLRDTEEYSAYIACNKFNDKNEIYVNGGQAKITQDGRDGDPNFGYITQISDGDTFGFKYFDCKGVKGIYLMVEGYCGGYFEIRTSIDGEVLGKAEAQNTDVPTRIECDAKIPDGVNALYITWRNGGGPRLISFGFIH